MSNPLSRIATRVAYGATQLPRVAWYVGHSLAMRRLTEMARQSGDMQAAARPYRCAGAGAQPPLCRHGRLLQQDLANVEAGIYPLPADHDGSLLALLDRSRLFFADLPDVNRRRESGGHSEVLTEETRAKRPRYYLQNFHFQSGGWMTEEFGAALRHPGRGAVQRHRQRHAAAGAAAAA